MALFDTSEDSPRFSDSATEEEVKAEVKWSEKEMTMRQAIGDLEPGKIIHFVTCGCWSCYELLKYVLQITGPAKVDAFTWNISMPAVTQILEMKRLGMWTQFRILVHSAMKRYTAEAISVMQSQVDKVVLYPNHAKGFVVTNDSWTVSVITSANFSNNANIEGGTISCDRRVHDMHLKWLGRFFEKKELESSEKIADHDMPPPAEITGNSLFVIRGLPGSGKTTFAETVADVVFSNDDYFYDLDGRYHFDRANIPRAKSECFARTKQAMEDGIHRIAVANTFVHEAGIVEYQELAKLYGYRCHVMTMENRHGGVNVHDVGELSITRMRNDFKVKL